MSNYPKKFIPRPFSDRGNIRDIPDTKLLDGQASYSEGFPVETQLPLANGGIAPSRLDFNGILNALSSLLFWQQAGGLWIYNANVGYESPAAVIHNGTFWFCTAANGPDVVMAGAVEPGTNREFWIDFIEFLARSGSAGGDSLFTPVGTICMYGGATPPDGYFTCDATVFDPVSYPDLHSVLGTNVTPDMRGLIPRGYDPDGVNDPDGTSRGFNSFQDCSIEKMTGGFGLNGHGGTNGAAYGGVYPGSTSGPFLATGASGGLGSPYAHSTNLNATGFSFDSSRCVKSSEETRGKNRNLLFIIKHD